MGFWSVSACVCGAGWVGRGSTIAGLVAVVGGQERLWKLCPTRLIGSRDVGHTAK